MKLTTSKLSSNFHNNLLSHPKPETSLLPRTCFPVHIDTRFKHQVGETGEMAQWIKALVTQISNWVLDIGLYSFQILFPVSPSILLF